MLLAPVFVLVGSVLANTESTVFVSKRKPGSSELNPNKLVYGQLVAPNSWSAPFNHDGRYFAKVCWPASQPADLSIEFNGTHINIDSVDSSVSVDGTNHTTEFTLLISSFKWGIPQDVFTILPYIVLALCTGVYLSMVGWPSMAN